MFGNHAGFEQPGGVGVDVEPVAEALGEPAVQFLAVAPDESENVTIELGAGQGMHEQMPRRMSALDGALRVAGAHGALTMRSRGADRREPAHGGPARSR